MSVEEDTQVPAALLAREVVRQVDGQTPNPSVSAKPQYTYVPVSWKALRMRSPRSGCTEDFSIIPLVVWISEEFVVSGGGLGGNKTAYFDGYSEVPCGP
mmetsp:Transcript_40554/g.90133  ORF Transcript_40554/g.90133 Transcript_40554/m.90133 type:complete len:99 (-) Transcript_40554:1537-1833(-)